MSLSSSSMLIRRIPRNSYRQSVKVRPALTPNPSITYSGITTGAASTVAAQHRKRMFYVVSALPVFGMAADISLDLLIAFDMFPKTYSVETVDHLSG